MAVIANMPAKDVIDSLRGVLDFYRWCDLVIVRKWPVYSPRERSPAVKATAERFAYINRQARDLDPSVAEAYHEMAKRGGLSFRDWLTRLYINGANGYSP